MKQKTIYFLCTLFLGAFALTGCDKDNDPNPVPADGGNIVFKLNISNASGAQTTGVQSKTAYLADRTDFSTTFTAGDEVGVFAVKRASGESKTLASSGNYIHNVKLTYSTAGGGTWMPSQTVNYPNDGSVLDFYAYYPYDAAATDPTGIPFSVKSDQSTALNYGNSDLLIATPAMGIAKEAVVNLTFSHKLSLIQVEVNPSGLAPCKSLALTVKGCAVATGFNLAEQTIMAASGGAQEIKMLRVEDAGTTTAYTYRALVPAQTVSAGTALCQINYSGENYTSPALSSDLALTSGKAERFTISLPSTILPINIEKVLIPAGTFIMGSPTTEPNRQSREVQHSVTLTRSFYMSIYEITNSQFAAFLNVKGVQGEELFYHYQNNDYTGGKCTWGKNNGQAMIFDSREMGTNWGLNWDWDSKKWVPAQGYGNHPVIYVTWYGAYEFACWAGGSLPTEAQWEYACRGDYPNKATEIATKPFGVGDGIELDNSLANVWNYSTLAAGQYLPNNYGLYDMHGNVHEICYDYTKKYNSNPVTDPIGSTDWASALRGGAYHNNPIVCRSAYWDSITFGFCSNRVGFRVVFVQ